MDYQEPIVRDPNVVGGEPVLTGSRAALSALPARLSEFANTLENPAGVRKPSEQHLWTVIPFALRPGAEDRRTGLFINGLMDRRS